MKPDSGKKNVFQSNQGPTEPIDTDVTELRNLAKNCEFGEIHDGLMTSKIMEGIRSDKVCDRLLRVGPEITLQKALTSAEQTKLPDNK